MNDKHNEIVEKIRKCLALSTSPNLNEAAAAMEMANRLMLKYNIELYQIEQAQQRAAEPISTEKLEFGVGRGAPANWRRELVFAIARHNFCRGLSWIGKREMTIVGERHNIAIVRHLYEFLAREIDRLADETYPKSQAAQHYTIVRQLYDRETVRNNWYDESPRSWKDSFRKATVRMLDSRLWKLREGLLDSKEQGLVLVKDKQLDDRLKQLFPNTNTHYTPPVQNEEAKQKGYVAGTKIPLHNPIEGTTTFVKGALP